MARVYPRAGLTFPSSSSSSSSTSSPYVTSERKVFTIWMKSIVLNGNGCTVFDASGNIVYRIDNYNSKCSNEVYLMDLRGSVLFTIHKKKLRLFGRWEGYRATSPMLENKKTWFQVRKVCRMSKSNSPCEVTVEGDNNESRCYRIETMPNKSACKIVNQGGGLVAEVKKKQTSSGVALGDDVLTLVVEPHIDHSLIMGIVTVYGLINRKM